MTVDFGRTAKDYATHRAGFPTRFYDRLARDGAVRPGYRVVDLGTGTGALARRLAEAGCHVTGVDVAAPLLAEAARLATAEGVAVTCVEARAEATGLPSGAFDLVCAGQCWHWFDRPRAAAEARRLLRPGGRALVAHFDWIARAGNLVAATEEVVRRHNPVLQPPEVVSGGHGLYGAWLRDLGDAGFIELETASFDVDVPYTHGGWRGRMRASASIGASLAPAAIDAFDAELAGVLAARFPEPLAASHRVWWLTGRAPA